MDDTLEQFEEGAKPERKSDGTFAKGTTGNPKGRPRKWKPNHGFPHDNHKTAIEIAEMTVSMTIDGQVEETTAYRASMLALARMAMSGDLRAIKMFRAEVHAAAAGNVHQHALTQNLLALLDEQEKELNMLRKHFPKFTGSGVVTLDQDGNMVPNGWMQSIRKLDELDTWEKRLEQREKAIRMREALLPEIRKPDAPGS